ncbi:hypothetical protein [Pseudomonas fluorescens]|uniref:hypothetical protein n=1 Tax=Pseudomonas fluorescens TaxID=294 RepID=UPI0007D05597|nr:hypothetical protein [Pseudomonas fluorescens]
MSEGEKEYNAKGTFDASKNGIVFLATKEVAFDNLKDDFHLLGEGYGPSSVAFTVSRKLEGLGPHTVTNKDAPVEWGVIIEGVHVEYESAEATFNFHDKYRVRVIGNITFTLKDKTTVKGAFDIERKNN